MAKHDTRELYEHMREKYEEKILDGEFTVEEYEKNVARLPEGIRAKLQIENMKAQKLQEAEEEYANDEISEEELEERMDELFESGDDFLDTDLEEQKKRAIRDKQKEEMKFKAKSVAQIVGYVAVAAAMAGAVIFTKGAAMALLPALLFATFVIYIFVL